MLGMPEVDELAVVTESKKGAANYADLRELMTNDNDDQESVISEAT